LGLGVDLGEKKISGKANDQHRHVKGKKTPRGPPSERWCAHGAGKVKGGGKGIRCMGRPQSSKNYSTAKVREKSNRSEGSDKKRVSDQGNRGPTKPVFQKCKDEQGSKTQ